MGVELDAAKAEIDQLRAGLYAVVADLEVFENYQSALAIGNEAIRENIKLRRINMVRGMNQS
jgi:hypothetical protein